MAQTFCHDICLLINKDVVFTLSTYMHIKILNMCKKVVAKLHKNVASTISCIYRAIKLDV